MILPRVVDPAIATEVRLLPIGTAVIVLAKVIPLEGGVGQAGVDAVTVTTVTTGGGGGGGGEEVVSVKTVGETADADAVD